MAGGYVYRHFLSLLGVPALPGSDVRASVLVTPEKAGIEKSEGLPGRRDALSSPAPVERHGGE